MLVILTGDLGSLVACRREAVARERTGSGSGGHPFLAWVPGDVEPERVRAAEAAAAWCRVDKLLYDQPTDPNVAGPVAVGPWLSSETLLRACRAALAVEAPISHVVAADGAIPGLGGDHLNLEAMGGLLDRALLVSQLAAVDAELGAVSGVSDRSSGTRGGRSVSPTALAAWRGIDLPLVDAGDAELIVQALELGVPEAVIAAATGNRRAEAVAGPLAGLARLCQTEGSERSCGVCAGCRRWSEALRKVQAKRSGSEAVSSAPAAASAP